MICEIRSALQRRPTARRGRCGDCRVGPHRNHATVLSAAATLQVRRSRNSACIWHCLALPWAGRPSAVLLLVCCSAALFSKTREPHAQWSVLVSGLRVQGQSWHWSSTRQASGHWALGSVGLKFMLLLPLRGSQLPGRPVAEPEKPSMVRPPKAQPGREADIAFASRRVLEDVPISDCRFCDGYGRRSGSVMKRESHVSEFHCEMVRRSCDGCGGHGVLVCSTCDGMPGTPEQTHRVTEIPFLSQVLSGRHCHVPCAVGVGHCTTTWRIPMGMQKRALIQDAEFD